MRRSSIYTSAAFHGIILIIAVMGLPFLMHHEFVIPQPITVDLIETSKVTETNRVTPQPAPPKPKPEPPKPQPAPQNMAPHPVAPVQEPPKPEEKKEIVKPTKAADVDENAPPEKTMKKVVKKQEAKKPPQENFSSVLKNLGVTKDQPAPPPGQNAPIGEKMTMSEDDAFRSQLEKCWDVPYGAKDADNMSIDIVMVINSDRTLQEAHITDMARYNSDSFFMAVADSALRAVRNPSCSPFDLPPDKYDTWNHTTVTFNPKDMYQ